MKTITKEMLDIINLVRAYKRYIIKENNVLKKDGFDWYEETQDYYLTLPLKGFKRNIEDFEFIILMDEETLKELNNKEF